MKTAHVYHLRDIILGGFALLFSAATFAIALLGVDEVPASVRSEAYAHHVAELCPHLPANEQPECLAWLRQGGRRG
jgi:acetyl-coA carboxylase, biotin carboxylase protein